MRFPPGQENRLNLRIFGNRSYPDHRNRTASRVSQTTLFYRRTQAAGLAATLAGFLPLLLLKTKSAIRGAISERKREPLKTP